MKQNKKANPRGPSAPAVPLRWGRLRSSLPQLRSTAGAEGGLRPRLDSRATVLEHKTVNQNKSHQVTPLLAQRTPLSGNSYSWRTADIDGFAFAQFGFA